MSSSKKYSKSEDLFILDSMIKYSSIKEGCEQIGIALHRSPSGVMQRFYDLKKEFPMHPACTKDWRVKPKGAELKWYQKIFKFFKNDKTKA